MNPLKQRTACPIPEGTGVVPKQKTAGAISLARAIWVAVVLTVTSGATTQAATLNFNIENNGGLVDLVDHLPVSVEGEFTWDTATNAISNFNVTFAAFSSVTGTYTDSSNPHLDLSDPYLPLISFKRYLSDGTPLLDVGLYLSGLGEFGPYTIVKGHWSHPWEPNRHDLYPRDGHPPTVTRVVSEPVVPEPSTWAMVLGAFASAAAWTGRRKMHLRG